MTDLPEPGRHRVEAEELISHLTQWHACQAAQQLLAVVQQREVERKLRNLPVLPAGTEPPPVVVDLGDPIEATGVWARLVKMHAEHSHAEDLDTESPWILHAGSELFTKHYRADVIAAVDDA